MISSPNFALICLLTFSLVEYILDRNIPTSAVDFVLRFSCFENYNIHSSFLIENLQFIINLQIVNCSIISLIVEVPQASLPTGT